MTFEPTMRRGTNRTQTTTVEAIDPAAELVDITPPSVPGSPVAALTAGSPVIHHPDLDAHPPITSG